jgi:hypothetical protein
MMRRRLAVLAVVVATMMAAGPASAHDVPPGGTFYDDDASIHQGWIEAIAAEGITRGCDTAGPAFCPNEPVTRGQMAAFLVRAFDLPGVSGTTFVDSSTSVFAGDIERIAAAGVTRGCNPPVNDLFCPSEPVTRAQMAAFLQRSMGLPDGAGDRFADDDGSVFEGAIAAIAAEGITSGCDATGTLFCPERAVTRAEMAAFLGRALDLAPIDVPSRPYEVAVIPRDAWGAEPVSGALEPHDIQHITIHHAGTTTGTVGPAQFRVWQAWHQFLGWPDVAYHYIIGRDGLVYEGRDHKAAGDTATEYDPTGHLLLVVEGDFDADVPTAAQIETLARLVAWGSQTFAVPLDEATGHRDHAATTCPGDSLYALIHDGTLRARAAALIAAGGVSVTVG